MRRGEAQLRDEADERCLDGRAVGHDGDGRPLRDPVEGIIEEDVDRCIRNLTAIGRDGMNETDHLVLDIMTHKC